MSASEVIFAPRPAVLPPVRSEPRRPPFRGLCSTCELADECTYPRDAERPVTQCEEFDDGVGQRLANLRAPGAAVGAVLTEGTADPSQWLGLCRTCESREVCAFPRPHGGVWQCEEYR